MARDGNCEYAQDCNLQGLPLLDLIAKLFYVDANGCYHLNTVLVSGECENLTPAIVCGTGETWEDVFRKSIVLDDCGNAALSVFYDAGLQ